MVNYKCFRCGYETISKTKFSSHLRRKYKCKPKLKDVKIEYIVKYYSLSSKIEPSQNEPKTSQNEPKPSQNEPKRAKKNYICEYCDKKFAHKQSLNKHINNRCKNNSEKKEYEDLKKLVDLLNTQLNEQKKEFKKELEIKNKQINELIKKTGIQNIGTQNIQNNIKILAYNNSDTSHLTDNDYMKILQKGSNCIPQLLEAIHFNPQKPENHNIYIPNIKNNYVMMWDGINWNLNNRDVILNEMYEDKSNILIDKIEEWIDIGFKLDPIIMKKFKRFLNTKEDDEMKNKIKDEIKLILYNKRNLIKEI